MKALITGITGRVGSRLAAALLDRGDSLCGLAIPNDPLLPRLPVADEVDLFLGDLQDPDRLVEAVQGVDVVVHLAAQMVLDDSPLDLYRVNVMGTMHLLEAVKEQASAPRFVLASTDGTYGAARPNYLPIDEEHPQIPGDYYSASKVLTERLLENYAVQFDVPYVILRFSTVIAPQESLSWFRYESSLNRLRRAQLGKKTNLWPLFVDHPDMDQILIDSLGNPTGNPAVALLGPLGEPWGMPITDVRDIVQAIVRVIELRDAPNDYFNIAGQTVTSKEGARIIANAFDLPIHEVELPVRWYYDVDTTKARRAFGYEPVWTFEKTVRDALESEASKRRTAS